MTKNIPLSQVFASGEFTQAGLGSRIGKSQSFVQKITSGAIQPKPIIMGAVERLTGVPFESWRPAKEDIDAFLDANDPKKSQNLASCDAGTETGAGNPVPQTQCAPGRSDQSSPLDQTGASDAQCAGQVAS